MKGDTSGGHNGSIERVCMEGPGVLRGWWVWRDPLL